MGIREFEHKIFFFCYFVGSVPKAVRLPTQTGSCQLDGSCDGHGCRSRCCGDDSRGCILCECCRWNSDLSGNCCELACCFIVGVAGWRCPCISIVCHSDSGEDRIEGICDDDVVTCGCLGVAVVLYKEGVSDLPILCNYAQTL